MNKKIFIVLTVLVLSLSLTGCKKKKVDPVEPEKEEKVVKEDKNEEPVKEEIEEVQKVEEEKPIIKEVKKKEPVKEEIPTVTKVIKEKKEENLITVNIPADYLDEFEDIDKSILEDGVEKIERNKDGSLTMVLKEETYKKLLTNMDNQIKQDFKDMTGSKDTPYIKKIEASKDYRSIIVFMDKEVYENSFDLTPLVVAMKGAKYQSYKDIGVSVNVVVKDNDTGEIISSANYPEDLPVFNGQ